MINAHPAIRNYTTDPRERAMTLKPLLFLAGAALLSACQSPRESITFPQESFRFEDGYDQRYLLWPGDTIEVSVLSAPELSREVTVAPDGRVRIPLSGPVTAAGRTADELRLAFTKAMSRELKDPEIEVITTGYASQQIFVGGEVESEAMYDLPGQIGPLQAIVMAGGFTNEARQKEVVLMRREPGGVIRTEVVNIRAGIFDPVLADWGPLRRFDVVYVPKSRIAEENLFVEQWIRNSLPIDISLFYDVRGLAN